MNVRYTRHARQRMAQRKVRHDEALATLEAADDLLPGDQDELLAIRRFGTYEIRVVFASLDEDLALVYTVIKTRIRR